MTRSAIACVGLLCLLATVCPAQSTTAPVANVTGPADRSGAEYHQERIGELEAEVEELEAEIEKFNIPHVWLIVGFIGQVIFGLRFVVQWIVTERRKKSVVPLAFWYLSLAGTVVLLTYSIYRLDPVFIAGFSLNMIIYLRNLYFIHIHSRKAQAVSESQADA